MKRSLLRQQTHISRSNRLRDEEVVWLSILRDAKGRVVLDPWWAARDWNRAASGTWSGAVDRVKRLPHERLPAFVRRVEGLARAEQKLVDLVERARMFADQDRDVHVLRDDQVRQ